MRGRWLAHGLFSRTTTTIHKRSILDITHYKNTHFLAKEFKHLSPFTGMVFAHTPVLRHFYNDSQNAKHPSATAQVVSMLFHEHENKFRQTYNKSNPAYSLSPALLGKVVKHLHDNTLQDADVKEAITKEWAKHHLQYADAKVSKIKITNLLDLMQQSLDECKAQQYPANYLYHILTAFLHYKAEEPADNLYYLNALTPINDVNITDKFTYQDILRGKQKLGRLATTRNDADDINDNIEDIVIALLSDEFKLKPVQDAQYGFQKGKRVANCVEAGYHNLCNILLYDETEFKFSFALLPDTLNPHANFIKLYADNHFNTTQVNSRETGQAFMDLVSGNQQFTYCQSNYELETTTNDFIPIMNFLFGAKAENYEELSRAFSTDKRKITFQQDMDGIEILIDKINCQRINIRFKFGITHAGIYTPFFAVRKKQEAILNEPLADFAAANINDQSLLFMATNLTQLQSFDDHTHVPVTDLIELVNHMNYYRRYWLCDSHELNVLEMLLKAYRQDPSQKSRIVGMLEKHKGMLTKAISSRQLHLVEFMLELGANPSQKCAAGFAPLNEAIRTKSPDIVNMLLKYGANPFWQSEQGENYLHCCAYRAGMSAMIPLFISFGIDLESLATTDKLTALHYAVMGNQLSNVLKLIELGANIECVNLLGDSPLMIAANYNHHEIVDALIKAGADINHTNLIGRTALHYAVMSGDVTNTALLLDKGANPNIYDQVVGAPLAYLKKYEIARLLLAKGASHVLSIKNNQHLIHVAAYMGYKGLLKIALDNNANPNELSRGVSPMMAGIIGNNNDDVMAALQEAGANTDETCEAMLHDISPFISHERFLDLRMRCKSFIRETENGDLKITIRLDILSELMNSKKLGVRPNLAALL